MAVFTPVSLDEARAFLAGYDLGEVVELTAIAEGVENTNYRLETQDGASRRPSLHTSKAANMARVSTQTGTLPEIY